MTRAGVLLVLEYNMCTTADSTNSWINFFLKRCRSRNGVHDESKSVDDETPNGFRDAVQNLKTAHRLLFAELFLLRPAHRRLSKAALKNFE